MRNRAHLDADCWRKCLWGIKCRGELKWEREGRQKGNDSQCDKWRQVGTGTGGCLGGVPCPMNACNCWDLGPQNCHLFSSSCSLGVFFGNYIGYWYCASWMTWQICKDSHRHNLHNGNWPLPKCCQNTQSRNRGDCYSAAHLKSPHCFVTEKRTLQAR